MNIRTRFAPSPTGNLHIGGARTALFNYLLSKKTNGSFVLRVEDTDDKRNIDQLAKEQYEDLLWLNIVPDESPFNEGNFGPYQQKNRLEIYENFFQILLKNKKAYYCFCTKDELEKERENFILKEGKSNYKYSRKCLSLNCEEIEKKINNKENYLIRFFIEKNKSYKFNDLVRGKIEFSSEDIEDFVIRRQNGIPLLNFVVAIDDHLMNITHILRAEEHLTNTSKQLAINEAFGWESPQFAHLSIIFNSQKKKISKRDDDCIFYSIKSLKNLGYTPQGIVNYLFFLGWSSQTNEEFFSIKEMEEIFDLSGFNSRSPVFSTEKLNWFNNHWIRKINDKEYNDYSWNFISKFYNLNIFQKEKVSKISSLFREQISCFSELIKLTDFFFKFPTNKIENLSFELKKTLEKISSEILSLNDWNEDNIKIIIIEKSKISNGYTKKQLFLTLRAIITGTDRGPELPKIISIIGKDEFKKRLERI